MTALKGIKDEIAAVTTDELRNQLILKRLVGKGGFAAVYFGTYKGQEVAVKVILAEHVSQDSLQVKLLLREGQYMSRCTHKNIVKCHAVCQLPGNFPGIEALGHRSSTWALVLEYIGGGSLAGLLMKQMSQTRKAYTDYEAYCWVRDVAGALNYLHNAPRPVMHRDVKADNVLLTEDENGRPTAKLMDFGLMAALDGKNPLLRRRSVSAAPGDGLGRTSTASISRASVGGGRNLSAPSVATYYNDTTHEPGKIFYLMDELPAPTVAALAGPAASRRVSLDFAALNGAAGAAANPTLAVAIAAAPTGSGGGGATPTAASPSTPGGITAPGTQFGFTPVASRGKSFDGVSAAAAAGGGGAGGGGTAAAGAAAASGIIAAAAAALPWVGPKPRSGISLVPLNEEASYHGNTSGYASMLLQQQQQRRQQRRAGQEAAAAVAAAAAAAAAPSGGSFGKSGAAGSSLPNSLHGNTRPESCSGGSPPSTSGGSPVTGSSPVTPGAFWPGEGLTHGSVRLRLVSEESGAMTPGGGGGGGGGDAAHFVGGGGGDAAIALAATRLSRQVSEQNGSLVRMSAPQPTPMSRPPSAPVALLEDESPPKDATGHMLLAAAANAAAFATTTNGRRASTPEISQQSLHQPPQQRASRPSSASHLPPIIAVAKPRPVVAADNGGAAAEVTPRESSYSSPASGLQSYNSGRPNGTANGNGGGNGALRRSSYDVVPLVGVDSGLVATADVRRSLASSVPNTSPLAMMTLSGVQAMTPPPHSQSLIDRQSSQKSIGSTRSGTGNGYMTDGAAAAAGGGGGGALASGGGGGAFSIAAHLQGRYENDFQWVWRLTGQTGSCMYMAPEVYRNLPYNEKVDVFSFGVLLYEVFSRTMLLVSALNLRELRLNGRDTPEGYAQTVAEGYRPPRPLAMPEPLYELMSACWADDPCARPNMVDVVETLRLLQQQYAPQPGPPNPSCGCAIS